MSANPSSLWVAHASSTEMVIKRAIDCGVAAYLVAFRPVCTAGGLEGSRRQERLWAERQWFSMSEQYLHVRGCPLRFSLGFRSSRFRWANVTVGLTCVIENTGYIVYSGSNEYVDIVSRYVLQLMLL